MRLSDLPEPERRAFLDQHIAERGLPAGDYDDAAHAAFLAAPAAKREKAERKADIARYLLSIKDHAGWPDRVALVRAKFGTAGTSKDNLKLLLRQVKGLDPINFAPALLPKTRNTNRAKPIAREAWSFFMTTISRAGPDFPLAQAYRDVRDVAKVRGWAWPSYPTVFRRWDALPHAQKLEARFGRDRAAKLLAQPVHRDKTTLAPLEILSLDGRTLDFWTDCGDGRAVRLTMLALVDVASNVVAGWRLCQSENASDTARLIRDTCEAFGIFDTLYTDNVLCRENLAA
ncbi:DNA-binding domain-containing protein [Meridianimarinicoccus aquatilis]|uniref:DNA-binding domain-containing protein n=1 Tax=Meridianimarinicoccus aquatilis TaxID=2552766 RepID=UPI0014055EAA|nr:DNA-binding domain-containing protein [Fluviibacterium aquatile]